MPLRRYLYTIFAFVLARECLYASLPRHAAASATRACCRLRRNAPRHDALLTRRCRHALLIFRFIVPDCYLLYFFRRLFVTSHAFFMQTFPRHYCPPYSLLRFRAFSC